MLPLTPGQAPNPNQVEPPYRVKVDNQTLYYQHPARKPFKHGWYIIILFGPPGFFIALLLAAFADWCHPKTAVAAKVLLAILVIIFMIGVVSYLIGVKK